MKLVALSNINSGQYNAGDVFEINDTEAEALIEAGAAKAFDAEAEQATEVPETPVVPEEAVTAGVPTEQPTAEAPATEVPLAQATEPKSSGKKSKESVDPVAEAIAQDVADQEGTKVDVSIQ